MSIGINLIKVRAVFLIFQYTTNNLVAMLFKTIPFIIPPAQSVVIPFKPRYTISLEGTPYTSNDTLQALLGIPLRQNRW